MVNGHVEAVHRVNNLGAVVTHVVKGHPKRASTPNGGKSLLVTLEGDVINRCELFDEADLGTALARFDQLSRPLRRLENAATRVYDRIGTYFAARDWSATAEAMAEDMVDDDRRHMVNAGIRRGRDVEIANSQATAQIGGESITSTLIATRADRLALCRTSILGRGPQSDAFRIEFLSIIEIDADERSAAHVAFDLDDFEAAIAELDARYLAGEAFAYAHTWSVIAGAYGVINRHEVPAVDGGLCQRRPSAIPDDRGGRRDREC